MGFPIIARPYGSFGGMEKIEIAEVLTQMIQRACLYENSKGQMNTPTTTASTTVYRSKMKMSTPAIADDKVDSLGEAFMEPVPVVSSGASYPNLVRINL